MLVDLVVDDMYRTGFSTRMEVNGKNCSLHVFMCCMWGMLSERRKSLAYYLLETHSATGKYKRKIYLHAHCSLHIANCLIPELYAFSDVASDKGKTKSEAGNFSIIIIIKVLSTKPFFYQQIFID